MGAVLSQLPQEALIVSNQATRHYGVSALSIYEEKIDEGQPKIWDSSIGKFRVSRVSAPLSQLVFRSAFFDYQTADDLVYQSR